MKTPLEELSQLPKPNQCVQLQSRAQAGHGDPGTGGRNGLPQLSYIQKEPVGLRQGSLRPIPQQPKCRNPFLQEVLECFHTSASVALKGGLAGCVTFSNQQFTKVIQAPLWRRERVNYWTQSQCRHRCSLGEQLGRKETNLLGRGKRR